MNDNEILWKTGDTVTDLDTGSTGTIADAGDGKDLDTMKIDWEGDGDEN